MAQNSVTELTHCLKNKNLRRCLLKSVELRWNLDIYQVILIIELEILPNISKSHWPCSWLDVNPGSST